MIVRHGGPALKEFLVLAVLGRFLAAALFSRWGSAWRGVVWFEVAMGVVNGYCLWGDGKV